MKEMKIGDMCFFYHSNAKPTAIVGIVRVTKEAYPDHTSWDKNSKYYDPTSTEANPKWFMVDVQLIRRLDHPIPLTELKSFKDTDLKQMSLLINSRLSVQVVDQKHWDFILSLEKQKSASGLSLTSPKCMHLLQTPKLPIEDSCTAVKDTYSLEHSWIT